MNLYCAEIEWTRRTVAMRKHKTAAAAEAGQQQPANDKQKKNGQTFEITCKLTRSTGIFRSYDGLMLLNSPGRYLQMREHGKKKKQKINPHT